MITMILSNPLQAVIFEMKMRGGSFVQQLAKLFETADLENRQRLMDAFPEIMEIYDSMASIGAGKGDV